MTERRRCPEPTRGDGTARLLLDRFLDGDGMSILLQPIWEDGNQGLKIFGYEALTRGPSDSLFESPEFLFDYIRRKRAEREADRTVLKWAIASVPWLPPGVRLTVNVHARTVETDSRLPQLIEGLLANQGLKPEQLVLVLLEEGTAHSFSTLISRLGPLRSIGVSIALDDCGAGRSNLDWLMACRPEILKLDSKMISGIDADSGRSELVRVVGELASLAGSRLLAEGVETPEELACLRRLGVTLFQGHLLAQSRPASELVSPRPADWERRWIQGEPWDGPSTGESR